MFVAVTTMRLQLLAMACLLFVGCVPFKVEVGRHTDGTVVSKDTRMPIVGAQVMYKGHPGTVVVTGADGRFSLERATVTKWLIPIPSDHFGWQWHSLKVRADGYRTLAFHQTREEPKKPLLIELIRSR